MCQKGNAAITVHKFTLNSFLTDNDTRSFCEQCRDQIAENVKSDHHCPHYDSRL